MAHNLRRNMADKFEKDLREGQALDGWKTSAGTLQGARRELRHRAAEIINDIGGIPLSKHMFIEPIIVAKKTDLATQPAPVEPDIGVRMLAEKANGTGIDYYPGWHPPIDPGIAQSWQTRNDELTKGGSKFPEPKANNYYQ